VRCILELAAEIDADLLVVGTDRHTLLRKFILGSVAESVLREAHCPVLVAMPKDYLTRVYPAAASYISGDPNLA
jgi:nucleotide-binding universal stress UspA family protein